MRGQGIQIGPDLTSRTFSCLCQGESDGEYRCLHEKTVHCAINDLFPSDIDGGPVHVGEHFGQNLIPVFEYEDKTWGGSCIRQSQGRSRAFIYYYADPSNTATCMLKVDCHKGLSVRCLDGGHFGRKADCCQAVLHDFNHRYPEQPAGFATEQTSRGADFSDCDVGDIIPFWWPKSDMESTAFCSEPDWRKRDPDRENLYPNFCNPALLHRLACPLFLPRYFLFQPQS
jgi:hypothetical protein